MTPRLIRTTGIFPPGSYVFTDRYTGKGYIDTHTTFDERVKQIIKDRMANARLFKDARFFSADYVSDELSEAICARLNGDPVYCTTGPQVIQTPQGPVTVIAGKVCRRCGSGNLETLYCQTCSSRRVVGYKCLACSYDMPA